MAVRRLPESLEVFHVNTLIFNYPSLETDCPNLRVLKIGMNAFGRDNETPIRSVDFQVPHSVETLHLYIRVKTPLDLSKCTKIKEMFACPGVVKKYPPNLEKLKLFNCIESDEDERIRVNLKDCENLVELHIGNTIVTETSMTLRKIEIIETERAYLNPIDLSHLINVEELIMVLGTVKKLPINLKKLYIDTNSNEPFVLDESFLKLPDALTEIVIRCFGPIKIKKSAANNIKIIKRAGSGKTTILPEDYVVLDIED